MPSKSGPKYSLHRYYSNRAAISLRPSLAVYTEESRVVLVKVVLAGTIHGVGATRDPVTRIQHPHLASRRARYLGSRWLCVCVRARARGAL